MVFVWILTLQVKTQGAFPRKKALFQSVKICQKNGDWNAEIEIQRCQDDFAERICIWKNFAKMVPNPFHSIGWNVGTDPIQTDIQVFIKTDGPEDLR